MVTKALIRIATKDKDGVEILRFERDSDSFVTNFVKFLGTSYYGVTAPAMVDTGGSARGVSLNGSLPVNAPVGNTHYGVVVGSGGTATTPDMYSLESIIENGSLAGYLSYRETAVNTVVDDGSYIDLEVTRTLINYNTSPVQINEVALIGYGSYYFMILRDVVDVAAPGEGTVDCSVILRTEL